MAEMEKESHSMATSAPFFWSESERLLAAGYRGFLVASPLADSFSGWTLGGAGVAFSVLLSGGDSTYGLREGASAAIWLMVAASVFAALGKLGAVSVSAAIGSTERVHEEANRLGAAGLAKIDGLHVQTELIRPLFWPFSRVALAMRAKGEDRLLGLRVAVVAMQIQAVAVFLQTVFLLAAASIIASHVR